MPFTLSRVVCAQVVAKEPRLTQKIFYGVFRGSKLPVMVHMSRLIEAVHLQGVTKGRSAALQLSLSKVQYGNRAFQNRTTNQCSIEVCSVFPIPPVALKIVRRPADDNAIRASVLCGELTDACFRPARTLAHIH